MKRRNEAPEWSAARFNLVSKRRRRRRPRSRCEDGGRIAAMTMAHSHRRPTNHRHSQSAPCAVDNTTSSPARRHFHRWRIRWRRMCCSDVFPRLSHRRCAQATRHWFLSSSAAAFLKVVTVPVVRPVDYRGAIRNSRAVCVLRTTCDKNNPRVPPNLSPSQ